MSTQRQRAVNATIAAAAREAEATSRREAEALQAPDRDASFNAPPAVEDPSRPRAETLAVAVREGLAPPGAHATSEALVASFRAMILGSDVDLAAKRIGVAPDRFAGQPPAGAAFPRDPSIGAIRVRSRRGK